jgi:hypothetical protein
LEEDRPRDRVRKRQRRGTNINRRPPGAPGLRGGGDAAYGKPPPAGLSAECRPDFRVFREASRRQLRKSETSIATDFEHAATGSLERYFDIRMRLGNDIPHLTGAFVIASSPAVFDLDLHALDLLFASYGMVPAALPI